MKPIENEYPCIICSNGDPYSNIVCDECEDKIELLKKVNESMISLVLSRNDISGSIPFGIYDEARDKVRVIFDMLCEIKITDTRKKNEPSS